MQTNKKVLVTGAGGFIGFNVVKMLNKYGFYIYAIVHNKIPHGLAKISNLEIIKGDMKNSAFLKNLNYDIDIVVHIAGIVSDIGYDSDFKKVNFDPLKYLVKIPKEKFILISSTDVYGIKDFINADEETPLKEYPKNPYPKYKIMSENYIKSNCNKYVFIRPAAVWGMEENLLESRAAAFLKTSPFIIHFGKWRGKNRWPMANVDYVAKTVVAACIFDNFDNSAINVIDPKISTIDEFYRNVALKYFPEKTFRTLYFPLWFGKIIGFIFTFLSNILHLKHSPFDPTFYAVHHVSSNLDFSAEKMIKILKLLDNSKIVICTGFFFIFQKYINLICQQI